MGALSETLQYVKIGKALKKKKRKEKKDIVNCRRKCVYNSNLCIEH